MKLTPTYVVVECLNCEKEFHREEAKMTAGSEGSGDNVVSRTDVHYSWDKPKPCSICGSKNVRTFIDKAQIVED